MTLTQAQEVDSRLVLQPSLGLIAAPLAFIGQVLVVLGVDVPLYVFIPNLPFELGAGLWLLLRGHPTEPPA